MTRAPHWVLLAIGLGICLVAVQHQRQPKASSEKSFPGGSAKRTLGTPPQSEHDSNHTDRASIQSNVASLLSELKLGEDEADIETMVSALAACENRQWVADILQSIPDRAFAGYLLNRLVQNWSRRKPFETATWLAGLPESIERTQATISAHRIWAESDPRAAVTHSLELSLTEGRQSSIAAALSTWIERDWSSAAKWVSQFAPDPSLDSARTEIARAPALIQLSPEVALSWAKSISNEQQRMQCIEIVLTAWFDRDRHSAITYVQDSKSFDDHQRAILGDELNL